MENGSRSKTGNGVIAPKTKATARKVELKDPDPDDVKKLVLDYLSHQCYLSTARALSKHQPPPSHTTEQLLPSSSPSRLLSKPAAHTNGPLQHHDADSEDVQMMSESLVLEGRAHANGTTTAAAPAHSNDRDDGESMAVDYEIATNGASRAFGSEGSNGDAGGDVNGGRPSVRFNPLLKVNGKNALSNGEFESLNSLYAGALTVEELNQIEQRGLIRAQILQGNIHSALSLVNTYFPSFFATPGAGSSPAGLYGTLPSSKVASSLSSDDPPSGSALNGDGPIPAPRTARPLSVVSTKPSHIQLNLLIQGFIETLRTVPVGPTPSFGNGNGRSSSPGASLTAASSPSSSVHSASSAVSATSSSALAQAKTLYMSVDQLKDGPSKEFYKLEVFGASGLLAYAPAESADAPTRAYLDYSRREALAEQVNSALLVHTGRHADATLDVVARQTSFVWDRLSYHNLDPVPPWTREDGTEWERLGQYFRTHRQFELGDFLTDV